jgi:hypothetical protein
MLLYYYGHYSWGLSQHLFPELCSWFFMGLHLPAIPNSFPFDQDEIRDKERLPEQVFLAPIYFPWAESHEDLDLGALFFRMNQDRLDEGKVGKYIGGPIFPSFAVNNRGLCWKSSPQPRGESGFSKTNCLGMTGVWGCVCVCDLFIPDGEYVVCDRKFNSGLHEFASVWVISQRVLWMGRGNPGRLPCSVFIMNRVPVF